LHRLDRNSVIAATHPTDKDLNYLNIKTMTGKERIQKTLNHEEPDRIPYDLSGTTVTAITKNAYQKAMAFRGLSTEYNPELVDPIQQIITPVEENLIKLKADARRIGATRILQYDKKKIVEGDMVTVYDFYGCKWTYQPEKDIYFNLIDSPLSEYEDISSCLDKLPRPDWASYIVDLEECLNRQVQMVGDFCGIADRNTAGFTENSLRIRGYENWFIDTMIDPGGVDALLEIILEDKIKYWDAVIDWALKTGNEHKIQVISECDDLGAQDATILEPDMLRTIVIPRIKRLFTHVKKRLPHVKTFLHCCGSIRPIIPDFIEAGLDILNPVQFAAKNMELKGLKKDFGKDITFWGGGVDTQSTLNNGTPEQVKDEVKRIIDIMAPGGGFVFAPVHNVQEDVPPENFWAMWDTLNEYR
jgi:uroporphyrinogen decarboxylase